MRRRELAQTLAGGFLVAARLTAAKARLSKARVSAITDELGATHAGALQFAVQPGLQLVELRTLPETKKEFARLTEPELKRHAAELAAARLKVAILKTSLLKQTLEYKPELLSGALLAANILGADKIRIFTGPREPDPFAALPHIAGIIGQMAPVAEKAGVRLAIENEPTQNVATGAELKALLDLLPAKFVGFNWDPQNARERGETPWPDGFAILPKARMLHFQIKAGQPGGDLNWRAMLDALQRDVYPAAIGVATEGFDADTAVRDVLHLVGML